MIEQPNWKINTKDYAEKNEILDQAKEELDSIHENLSEKKITVDEAKSELKRINERIKWTNLEHQNKEKIWKAFDKLAKLEKNIDESTLKDEVSEIINLLETITQRDLASLKDEIIKSKKDWINNRPVDVQKWLKESAWNLTQSIDDATEDRNPIAKRIGKAMKRLNS